MDSNDELGWPDEGDNPIEENNKIEVQKVSIISKLKWRLLYKECYKKFGYDVSKINLLLNNKNIAQYYKNNKEEIHRLLNLYESTTLLLDISSDLFNVILQSAQRGTADKVMKKIENCIAQINRVNNDKERSIRT